MEDKEQHAVIPITELNQSLQEYVYWSNKLDALNAELAKVRAHRKRLHPLVCEYLEHQPDNKQKLSVPENAVGTFGKSYIGLCLYKRKRTKEFNSKTFLKAMIDKCVPLFQKAFKSNTQKEQIEQFAELLAKDVWNTRVTSTKFEIMALHKTKTERKRNEADMKKRKTNDDNDNNSSRLKQDNPSAISDEDSEDKDF